MIVGNPVARNYQSRAIVAAPAMHENRARAGSSSSVRIFAICRSLVWLRRKDSRQPDTDILHPRGLHQLPLPGLVNHGSAQIQDRLDPQVGELR